MTKLIAVACLLAIQAFAASPVSGLRKVFTGKAGWAVSIAAFGGAEGSDYRTTRVSTSCGAGREGNIVLTNPDGTLNVNRFAALKVTTFVEPIAVESYLYYRMSEKQRQKWGKWFTVGNWVAAGVVGAVAAHNHWISQSAGCQ